MTKGTPGSSTKLAVYERDEHRCRYCGIELFLPGQGHPMFTIDHVVPKSRGGNVKDPANLVACCWQCNDRKRSFLLEEIGMVLLPCPNEGVDIWALLRERWPERTPPKVPNPPRRKKRKQEIHPFVVTSLNEALYPYTPRRSDWR